MSPQISFPYFCFKRILAFSLLCAVIQVDGGRTAFAAPTNLDVDREMKWIAEEIERKARATVAQAHKDFNFILNAIRRPGEFGFFEALIRSQTRAIILLDSRPAHGALYLNTFSERASQLTLDELTEVVERISELESSSLWPQYSELEQSNQKSLARLKEYRQTGFLVKGLSLTGISIMAYAGLFGPFPLAVILGPAIYVMGKDLHRFHKLDRSMKQELIQTIQDRKHYFSEERFSRDPLKKMLCELHFMRSQG